MLAKTIDANSVNRMGRQQAASLTKSINMLDLAWVLSEWRLPLTISVYDLRSLKLFSTLAIYFYCSGEKICLVHLAVYV